MQFTVQKTTTTTQRAKPVSVSAFGPNGSSSESDTEADETSSAARRRVGRSLAAVADPRATAPQQTDDSIYDFDAWKRTEEGRGQKTSRRVGAKRKYGVVYSGKGGSSSASSRPKSRYIGRLLKKSEERKRAQEIIREKARHRDLKKEIEEFGETETFVTSGYKKKLMEDRKWLEARERADADAEEKPGDDMSGFYRNLLTRNTAMGATAGNAVVKKKKKKKVEETVAAVKDTEDQTTTNEKRKPNVTDAPSTSSSSPPTTTKKTTASTSASCRWFAANARRHDDLVKLPSGLQYRVLSAATSTTTTTSFSAATPCVCHYRGTLIDGTVFDDSRKRGRPSTFRPDRVIAGWTEALSLMSPGDRWEIFVPPELGYGTRRKGSIPPNSILIFDLELLSRGDNAAPASSSSSARLEAARRRALARRAARQKKRAAQ